MGGKVGELLICEAESENASNQFIVAMKKEGTIIGHLLEAVVCVLFIVEDVSCD